MVQNTWTHCESTQSFRTFLLCLRGCCSSAGTHCVCGELGGVVIDISDPDDSGGCVGQTICGVPLHVGGLDDQGVLGDFLKTKTKGVDGTNVADSSASLKATVLSGWLVHIKTDFAGGR